MSTLSSRGMDALLSRQQTAAGVSVTYTRASGGTPLTPTVIPGQTVYTASDVPGRVEISARDYLVAVADLMVAGVESPPAVGDRIAETINGTLKTFEVQDPDNGEPCWRYGTQSRKWYRLHMKAV